MESKVEMSPTPTLSHNGAQERIYQSNKPTTVLRKRSSQFIEVLPNELQKKDRPSEETDDNIALNLCPDGNEINISINGTTLNATKTSLNVTIGNFIININCLNPRAVIMEDESLPPTPTQSSLVALGSFIQQNPLHVLLGESPHDVTATLSLSKLNCIMYVYVIVSYVAISVYS